MTALASEWLWAWVEDALGDRFPEGRDWPTPVSIEHAGLRVLALRMRSRHHATYYVAATIRVESGDELACWLSEHGWPPREWLLAAQTEGATT